VIGGRREHDAVREARDALVILAAAVPVTAAIAVLIGVVWGDVTDWAIWMIGTVVVAVLLLGTLGSAPAGKRAKCTVASPAHLASPARREPRGTKDSRKPHGEPPRA